MNTPDPNASDIPDAMLRRIYDSFIMHLNAAGFPKDKTHIALKVFAGWLAMQPAEELRAIEADQIKGVDYLTASWSQGFIAGWKAHEWGEKADTLKPRPIDPKLN